MRYFTTLVFFYLFSLSILAHDAGPQQDHIAVVGVGEVEQEPDLATLSITVEAREPDLLSAKKVADERYRKVLAVIEKAGIKDEAVTATQIIAQPEYEWRDSKRIFKGERVSRTLSIEIDELDKISPLMQSLVENEVSTINGLTTGFKDRTVLINLALAAAADNAKSKAEFLANRLGRSLGEAFLITEFNDTAPQVMQAESMMQSRALASDAAPPPERFGKQSLRVQINVSFALL